MGTGADRPEGNRGELQRLKSTHPLWSSALIEPLSYTRRFFLGSQFLLVLRSGAAGSVRQKRPLATRCNVFLRSLRARSREFFECRGLDRRHQQPGVRHKTSLAVASLTEQQVQAVLLTESEES